MKKSSIVPVLILMLILTLSAALAERGVDISAKNFPDEAFRKYVTEKIDADKDGKLSSEEIAQAESINASYLGICDLTGIEFFTELKELCCIGDDIGLRYLDVSKNTKLEILRCERNNLLTLDLSNNADLTELWCSQNTGIDDLDLSHNTRLAKLSCYGNSLTHLNISGNKSLVFLDCSSNQLTELDAHENTELVKLDCHENQLKTLDVSDCQKLTELTCYGNRIEKLDISSNTALIKLNCESNCLAFLDVSSNRQLNSLSCSYNCLAFVDLSHNGKLKELNCVMNRIEVTTRDGKIPYDMIPGINSKYITNVIGAEKGADAFIVTDSVSLEYSYDYGRGLTATYTIDVNYIKTGISSVSIPKKKYYYSGSVIEPTVTVRAKAEGKTIILKRDIDYTVTYDNNVDAGTATVTVEGKGSYTGTIRKNFTISKVKLFSMKLNKKSLPYTGKAQKPNVIVKAKVNGKIITLKKTDYTVAYKKNVNAGTATVTVKGKGGYTGTVSKTFTITPVKILKVSLSNYKLPYTGKARKPIPTVTTKINGQLVTLVKGTDYTVRYENNTETGTAVVTITGKGNYTGTITKTFTITAP